MFQRTILIIDEGTFGLSTTWHLLEAEKCVRIIVIDNVDVLASSRDFSKFVRTDYIGPERSIEIMKVRRYWTNHKLFASYFYCIDRLVEYSQQHREILAQINQTRLHLNFQEREIREANTELGTTRISFDYQWVHNENDDVVRWNDVMQAVKTDCIQRQITFRFAHVTQIVKNDRVIIDIQITKKYISITHMKMILVARF